MAYQVENHVYEDENAANHKGKKTKYVLVVEDDNTLRNTMARFLRKAGYVAQSVANGFEALMLMQYQQPDLVITDIRMPKLGGLTMVEGMKNRPETKDIPIILITAYREEKYYERAREAGAMYFLLKPFTLDELREKIDAALKQGVHADIRFAPI